MRWSRYPELEPFSENVSYGFHRNLFAVKWPALGLNLGGAALI
jgi:hypothetical protein